MELNLKDFWWYCRNLWWYCRNLWWYCRNLWWLWILWKINIKY